jgi:hypothetical protein
MIEGDARRRVSKLEAFTKAPGGERLCTVVAIGIVAAPAKEHVSRLAPGSA